MRPIAFLALAVLLFINPASGVAGSGEPLPPILLKGEDGSAADGSEWSSTSLAGRPSLVLYVDPGKRKSVTPLIDRIDSLNYPTEALGITFVVNTSATRVPDFMIRKMIKRRSGENTRIEYVLDRSEAMIGEWGFTSDFVNTLLLSPSGEILDRHAGEITSEYIDTLVKKIDQAVRGDCTPDRSRPCH